MSESTVARLRQLVTSADSLAAIGIGTKHLAVASDDLAALLAVVDDVAHADLNNAHLYCPFCGGDVRHPREHGYDHCEDCAYSLAQRLDGMDGDA